MTDDLRELLSTFGGELLEKAVAAAETKVLPGTIVQIVNDTNARVVIDGSTTAVETQNTAGSQLVAGARVLVLFFPPHGAVILGPVVANLGPGGGTFTLPRDPYRDLVMSMNPWSYWRLGESDADTWMLDGITAADDTRRRDASYHTTRWGHYLPLTTIVVNAITASDLDGLDLGQPGIVQGALGTAARFRNQLAWASYHGWPWFLQFTVAWWASVNEPVFDAHMMVHGSSDTGDITGGGFYIEDEYAPLYENEIWSVDPYAGTDDSHFNVQFNPVGDTGDNPQFLVGVPHLWVVRQSVANVIGSASGAFTAEEVDRFVTVGQWDATRFYVPGELVTHISSGWQRCIQQNLGVAPADDGVIWEALTFDAPVLSLWIDDVEALSGAGIGSTPGAPTIDAFYFGTPPNTDEGMPTVGTSYTLDESAVWSRPISDDEVAALWSLGGLGIGA